ncbi:hypothetical protein ACTFIZ_010059 [Dictyostelium cf. discoideum]
MKYLFRFFIFLFCIIRINSQLFCNFKGTGVDYNIDLVVSLYEFNFNVLGVNYLMTTCASINCKDWMNTMICGQYNSTTFQLAIFGTSINTINKNGVSLQYVSEKTPPNHKCPTITSTIKYICDVNVVNGFKYDYDYLDCDVQIKLSALTYCQKCSKCVASHGSCNRVSGWCTCDSYTMGLNCDQLKASISSVVAPTIDGGNVVISGDFSSIYSLGPSIVITIGSLVCGQVSFATSTTQISCTIGAGQGYQNLTLSDGSGSKLVYTQFYYHYPCQEDCAPYGTCNDVIGKCTCNYKYSIGADCKTLNLQLTSVIPTLLGGGEAYLVGDFSNVIGLTLSVKIGTLECTNVNFNETTLQCTIKSGEGVKDIIITSDLLTYSKIGAYEYQYYTCPLGCLHGTCNKYNGKCDCNNGTYGDQCQYIQCPLDCSTPNGVCDINTGICNCDDDKYSGEACDFIKCPLDCSAPNGVCDGKTGICNCDEKHSGDSCQFLQCPLNCSTPNGVCDRNTGICTCDSKYSGEACDFIKCPLDCSAPNGTCDGKTGICKCNNPYTGESCHEIAQCKQECSLKHGICDSHTLGCICDTQTKGLSCEESRLSIESVDPTNLDGGTTTITGYFGKTTSLLSIKIGVSQCTNIKVESDTKLKCDIGPGEGTHNVTITDDDLSYTGVDMFQYVGQINKISKISGGAIAGIAAGCVVGVSVLGAGGYYQYRKNKKIELFM